MTGIYIKDNTGIPGLYTKTQDGIPDLYTKEKYTNTLGYDNTPRSVLTGEYIGTLPVIP